MLYTDYFRSVPDQTWSFARQCGITHGTIRLPEDDNFDVCDESHIRTVVDRFIQYGIRPVVVEPLPNSLHDHIKLGDEFRDSSIEKFIKLMKNLSTVGITTVCFNFMAHYGWTRTHKQTDRGKALVTGFSLDRFNAANLSDDFIISAQELCDNYVYFLRSVIPYAERYGIKLALHPDDPPLPKLIGTSRIFTSLDGIRFGMNAVKSPNLGITFCQACFYLMGTDLEKAINEFREKIFFIHFRNVSGTKVGFHETFHDGGDIDMSKIMRIYIKNGIDVPIRVDHVPTLYGETEQNAGYDLLGRLFAIGYMKGILKLWRTHCDQK